MSDAEVEAMDVDEGSENIPPKSNVVDEAGDTEMSDKDASPAKEPESKDTNEEPDDANMAEDPEAKPASGNGHVESDENNDTKETVETEATTERSLRDEDENDDDEERKSVSDISSEDVRKVIFQCFADPEPDEVLTRRVVYQKLSDKFGFDPTEWKSARKNEIKDFIAQAMAAQEDEVSDPPPEKPKKSKSSRKPKAKKSRKRRRSRDEDEEDVDSDLPKPPKKRRRKSSKTTEKNEGSDSEPKSSPKKKSRKKRSRKAPRETESEQGSDESGEDERKVKPTSKKRGKGKKRRTKLEKLKAICRIAGLVHVRVYRELKSMTEKQQIRHLESLLDDKDISHTASDLTEDAIAKFKLETQMDKEVEELNISSANIVSGSGRPSRRNTRIDYSKLLEGPKLEFPSDEEMQVSEPEESSDGGSDEEFVPSD